MPVTKNKGGAPSKYKPVFARQAEKLWVLGFTEKKIADLFEVSVSTISKWKLDYKRFSEALSPKAFADGTVAQSLFKRANGFYVDEVTFEKVSVNEDLNGENIKVDAFKKKVVTKYIIPDVGAQTLWLKNRQKDIWREKQEDEYSRLSEEQVDEIFKRLQKKLDEKETIK